MFETASSASMRAPPALQLTDSLGCQASKLYKNQELVGSGITFYRKRSDEADLARVATPAANRGFLVGVSQRAGHSRRIFHAHHSTSHSFAPHAVYVRNFSDDYRADLQGGFDFLLLEVSQAHIDRATDEAGLPRIHGLVSVAGREDARLSSLLSVLMPALDRPAESSVLFVGQLATAIGTYLIDHYGGMRHAAVPLRRQLSRAQELRAKDMLRSRLDGGISIAEVAQACELSRSYFTLAFRETTGCTPHQWLLQQRVERARTLLRDSPMGLAEVATSCGFADQSHLTRVFSRFTGTTPGHWRRATRR